MNGLSPIQNGFKHDIRKTYILGFIEQRFGNVGSIFDRELVSEI